MMICLVHQFSPPLLYKLLCISYILKIIWISFYIFYILAKSTILIITKWICIYFVDLDYICKNYILLKSVIFSKTTILLYFVMQDIFVLIILVISHLLSEFFVLNEHIWLEKILRSVCNIFVVLFLCNFSAKLRLLCSRWIC